MMKSLGSILLFLIFFQLNGQAWPNNLIFTLKPQKGVEYLNKTLGFEVIEQGVGDIFIGKFKNPNEAEVAQKRLDNVGVSTDMLAFFRARPIDLDDAKILCDNMNAKEESTMLSGTKTREWPGKIMRDTMKIEANNGASNIGEPIAEEENETKYNESASNNSFYTIQLGVFSKTSKHKFPIEVKEMVINGKYYCFYGQFSSIDDANSELVEMKDIGYNDAFITGFDQGKKVSPSEVKSILDRL